MVSLPVLVDRRDRRPRPNVGYVLETQTKPIYDRPPDELTLAHDAAHMYFGDSVTLEKWRDIWLAKGFAEFSSWMWSEHCGNKTAQQFFDGYYKEKAKNAIWHPAPVTRAAPPTSSPPPSTAAVP